MKPKGQAHTLNVNPGRLLFLQDCLQVFATNDDVEGRQNFP